MSFCALLLAFTHTIKGERGTTRAGGAGGASRCRARSSSDTFCWLWASPPAPGSVPTSSFLGARRSWVPPWGPPHVPLPRAGAWSWLADTTRGGTAPVCTPPWFGLLENEPKNTPKKEKTIKKKKKEKTIKNCWGSTAGRGRVPLMGITHGTRTHGCLSLTPRGDAQHSPHPGLKPRASPNPTAAPLHPWVGKTKLGAPRPAVLLLTQHNPTPPPDPPVHGS